MKLLFASTFILFSALLPGQDQQKLGADTDAGAEDRKAWEFPQELRPQLQSRLERFLKAQADGNWKEVAQMLGSYRRGYQYLEYTPEHKACFITQMQTMPMVAFDFSVRESPFSSEIMFTPAGRRWWTLVGEGSFQKGAETVKQHTSLVAYRNRDDWYFTPPPFDDDAWARAHLGPEIARDHGSEVELIAPSGFPLEVVDLHVFIDPEHPASRKVQFRLHNKAAKRVTAYSFEISDARRGGSISVGRAQCGMPLSQPAFRASGKKMIRPTFIGVRARRECGSSCRMLPLPTAPASQTNHSRQATSRRTIKSSFSSGSEQTFSAPSAGPIDLLPRNGGHPLHSLGLRIERAHRLERRQSCGHG